MTYFDDSEKQYQSELILKPLIHTKLEIEKIIKFIGGEKNEIIDFGAGTGRLTMPLLRKGKKIRAVDVSNRSLEKLKQLAAKSGYKNLVVSNKLTSVNIISGSDVLHHVDIKKFLPIFYKNLKPRGKIIFSEPNGLNIFWYFLIFFKLDWKEEKGLAKINYFNVIRNLRKSGFEKIKIEGLGIIPGPFCFGNEKFCRLNYWLGNLPIMKLFAYRLIISARKN